MKYLDPFNLATFCMGLGALIFCAGYAPDWDIGISIIMAGFAYLTAAPAIQLLKTKYWALSILFCWWTVDGCYSLYWSIVNPEALAMMRDVNWPASLCLYLSCGLVWSLKNT